MLFKPLLTYYYFFCSDGARLEELKAEIGIMKLVGHPNVIAFFGCNTIFMPYLIVLEYAQFGDLENYLVKKISMVSMEWCHQSHSKSNVDLIK